MVLLGDFLIIYQEVNQLPIYKRGLNSIKKSHPPKEAPRMPERPDPLDFLALISSSKPWTPPGFLSNYIIRTFILAKFGYKFWDGTCALLITKN